MKSDQQSTNPPNLGSPLTESVKETPPHGMKGPLQSEAMVSVDAVLIAAVLVLLLAAIISGLVFVWTKIKARAKSQVLMGDFASIPSLWAELRRSIVMIKIPKDDQATDQQSWNQFTSDVSLHLRRGIELRTQKPVAERTTEEILRLLALGTLKVPVISEHELKSTLSRLDAVRFGGLAMTTGEAETLLSSVQGWLARLEADQISEMAKTVPGSPIIDEKGGIRVFDT